MTTIKEVMLEYILADPDYPKTILQIKSEVEAKAKYVSDDHALEVSDLTDSRLNVEIERALNELIREKSVSIGFTGRDLYIIHEVPMPELEIVVWNTGCYTPQGQRIAATYFNGHVYFEDVDRHIDGGFKSDGGDVRAQVNYAYENGCTDYSVCVPADIHEALQQAARAI